MWFNDTYQGSQGISRGSQEIRGKYSSLPVPSLPDPIRSHPDPTQIPPSSQLHPYSILIPSRSWDSLGPGTGGRDRVDMKFTHVGQVLGTLPRAILKKFGRHNGVLFHEIRHLTLARVQRVASVERGRGVSFGGNINSILSASWHHGRPTAFRTITPSTPRRGDSTQSRRADTTAVGLCFVK